MASTNTQAIGNVNLPTATANISVSIEDLYKYFGILADAKEDAGKHVDVYLKIIAGTKSGTNEKKLAAQFITRFFKHFPKEMPCAIEAIFDLCEDDDVIIRRTAIKDLASLGKDCAVEHLVRIADILTQLLQTEDMSEFIQVQSSLFTIFKLNPKSALNEIFNQINTAVVEEVRKRAIKFLVAKLPAYLQSVTVLPGGSKDLEEIIIRHVKTVLIDVDAEEFILFIRLLTALPSMNSVQGRQDLVNIIMAQSELDKPFNANDAERLMILLSCIQQAIPLFSKNVHSNRFVNSYLDNVLTIVTKISDETVKFETLKAFAELCSHYQQQNVPQSTINIEILYNILIEYLPRPLEATAAAAVVSADEAEEAKFNFSYVECLMYSFHVLARSQPEFLCGDENKERLKEFRLRLQYFAKGTQNYIKELRNSISNTSITAKENEENKIRRVALRVTTNIDLLIKDLFHNPPSYKSVITLSWKLLEQSQKGNNESATAAATNKRSLSASNLEIDSLKKKPERGIYTPPSGKYSTTTTATTTAATEATATNKRRIFSNANRRGGGARF